MAAAVMPRVRRVRTVVMSAAVVRPGMAAVSMPAAVSGAAMPSFTASGALRRAGHRDRERNEQQP